MDEYKNTLKALARQTIDTGLPPIEAIQSQIKQSQSVIRYATGEEFKEAREEHQAILEVSNAQLEAHAQGSLEPIKGLLIPDSTLEVHRTGSEASISESLNKIEPTGVELKPLVLFKDLAANLAAQQVKTGRWSEGSQVTNRQYFNTIIKRMNDAWGSEDVYARTLEDWERLQETFMDDGVLPSSLNKYISVCKAVMKYAGDKVSRNDLTRLINISDKEDNRGVYTPAQTRLLVQSALSGQSGRPELDQALIIAAYTGMRANEVVGLMPDDYLIEKGRVAGILIRNTERRTLKNKDSQRVVPTPIWPIDQLTGKQWQPDVNLFAQDASYKGESGKLSTNYRRFMVACHPDLSLDEDGKSLVFHSHRGAAITRAARAGVPEAEYGQIMGHAGSGEGSKTYLAKAKCLDDVKYLVDVVKRMNEPLK
ncbi:hypothetical protein VN23_11775 [Janthinobacterium sp. B9-8]|nr:hypothetical protein VN23_11775 [Janthinobacterium sp. B9-8]